MSPEDLFGLAGTAAMAGWLILLLAPRRWPPLNLVPAVIIPLGLSALYAVLVLRHFTAAGGGYDSLAAVRQLLSSDWMLLAGWVHYLAFDLAIGAVLARRMDAASVARLVQAPVLAATFLFGPLGFLLGTLVTAARTPLRLPRIGGTAHVPA